MTTTYISKNYRPSEEEEYMNPKQMEYFKKKLIAWKNELINKSKKAMESLREERLDAPDVLDNASSALEIATEIKIHNGHEKLINKIDNTLKRIENKTYGYCTMSGAPIGLKRLEARPIATLCVEDQEFYEKQRSKFRR
jgi:DnaK suppressor protein